MITNISDNYSPKHGKFKLEVINALTMEVVDVEADNNMIMVGARTVMSRLFAGIQSASLPDRFVIGTQGHYEGSILTPKDSTQGFVKERNTLFSLLTKNVNSGDIVDLIRNDYVFYSGGDSFTGLYKYVGNTIINLTLSDDLIDSDQFEFSDDLPESYTTEFTMPNNASSTGDDANATNGAVIKVLVSGTSVTFNVEIGTDYGNGEDNASIYTEAGIFAGEDLFCMKTFPAKIKDRTVIFRINWTIVF